MFLFQPLPLKKLTEGLKAAKQSDDDEMYKLFTNVMRLHPPKVIVSDHLIFLFFIYIYIYLSMFEVLASFSFMNILCLLIKISSLLKSPFTVMCIDLTEEQLDKHFIPIRNPISFDLSPFLLISTVLNGMIGWLPPLTF